MSSTFTYVSKTHVVTEIEVFGLDIDASSGILNQDFRQAAVGIAIL